MLLVLGLAWLGAASLECALCEAGLNAALAAVAKGDKPLTLSLLTFVCRVRKIEDAAVCKGVVSSFGDELFAALAAAIPLQTPLLCHGLGACPRPASAPWWNVSDSFPRPKPPLVPPSYSGRGVYRVLHLTDLHVDHRYAVGTPADCGEPVCCRVSSPDRGTRRARPFGEYGCDVPDTTVAFVLQAAAAQMKNNGAQVLLWTGDSPPHFLWTQTKEAVLNDTALVSAEIRAVLGAVDTVVPSIGNHESYPVNNFGPPPLQSWLYAQLAADWGPWLPPDAAANLSRAGYFAIRRPALVEGGKALKIISLQTNYCNNLAFFLYINDTDPGNQLRWLITELQDSEDRGEAVYVTGHIAPGSTDCREEWSERVAAILARYENTVAGQMFGHTHHDSFSVATAAEGRRATGVQYVSPSVTTQTNINPSWRYYVVDVATHQIVDTETWHVDLTAAYASGRMTASLLYSARNAYGMTSLFPEDWKALAGRIASDNATFELYSNFFHTGNKAATCDAQCRESELCTLVSATSALYHACTKQPQESHC